MDRVFWKQIESGVDQLIRSAGGAGDGIEVLGRPEWPECGAAAGASSPSAPDACLHRPSERPTFTFFACRARASGLPTSKIPPLRLAGADHSSPLPLPPDNPARSDFHLVEKAIPKAIVTNIQSPSPRTPCRQTTTRTLRRYLPTLAIGKEESLANHFVRPQGSAIVQSIEAFWPGCPLQHCLPQNHDLSNTPIKEWPTTLLRLIEEFAKISPSQPMYTQARKRAFMAINEMYEKSDTLEDAVS